MSFFSFPTLIYCSHKCWLSGNDDKLSVKLCMLILITFSKFYIFLFCLFQLLYISIVLEFELYMISEAFANRLLIWRMRGTEIENIIEKVWQIKTTYNSLIWNLTFLEQSSSCAMWLSLFAISNSANLQDGTKEFLTADKKCFVEVCNEKGTLAKLSTLLLV